MKKHKWILLVILIILFIIGVIFIMTGSKDDYDNRLDNALSVVKVPVLNVDVSKGDIINESMLKIEEFNPDEIDDDTITSMTDIIGKEALIDINKDETIKESDLK